jgi:hypothetical protein
LSPSAGGVLAATELGRPDWPPAISLLAPLVAFGGRGGDDGDGDGL